MATNSSCKILFWGLLVWILIVCLTGFQQNKYTIRLERAEILSYNRELINGGKARTFKYNRTSAALNFSMALKGDLGYDLMVDVEFFKLASNEYRPFPIAISRNTCSFIETKEFGISGYTCDQMPLCPVKKGNYDMCNWMTDYSKFPPLIPAGRYAAELTYKYISIDLAVFRVYVTIEYPLRRSN